MTFIDITINKPNVNTKFFEYFIEFGIAIYLYNLTLPMKR